MEDKLTQLLSLLETNEQFNQLGVCMTTNLELQFSVVNDSHTQIETRIDLTRLDDVIKLLFS